MSRVNSKCSQVDASIGAMEASDMEASIDDASVYILDSMFVKSEAREDDERSTSGSSEHSGSRSEVSSGADDAAWEALPTAKSEASFRASRWRKLAHQKLCASGLALQPPRSLRAPPGLALPPVLAPPPGLAPPPDRAPPPPPGLAPPPGVVLLGGLSPREAVAPFGVKPPPGLLLPTGARLVPRPTVASHGETAEPPSAKPTYTARSFRCELMSILRELKAHRNVALAVRQVRMQGVPQHRQAAEYADILTLAVEEPRGSTRQSFIAFVGGLTKAFQREQCSAGLDLFFGEIYDGLREEVPSLGRIVTKELVPTLQSLLEDGELSTVLRAVHERAQAGRL